eukprot:SAG31_NODE_10397_length_1143_cov_2.170498_1_plen_313_part_10
MSSVPWNVQLKLSPRPHHHPYLPTEGWREIHHVRHHISTLNGGRDGIQSHIMSGYAQQCCVLSALAPLLYCTTFCRSSNQLSGRLSWSPPVRNQFIGHQPFAGQASSSLPLQPMLPPAPQWQFSMAGSVSDGPQVFFIKSAYLVLFRSLPQPGGHAVLRAARATVSRAALRLLPWPLAVWIHQWCQWRTVELRLVETQRVHRLDVADIVDLQLLMVWAGAPVQIPAHRHILLVGIVNQLPHVREFGPIDQRVARGIVMPAPADTLAAVFPALIDSAEHISNRSPCLLVLVTARMHGCCYPSARRISHYCELSL